MFYGAMGSIHLETILLSKHLYKCECIFCVTSFIFFTFILKTVSLFMFFIFYFLQAIKNTVLLAI